MAYIKTVWQDSPSTSTPINAENLNNIESGIEDLDTRLTGVEEAGIVESFNGRTGTVTPTNGDYSAEQITYDNATSGLTADDVQEAIDELADEKADSATTLSGYGITDAYTKTETDAEIDAEITNIGTFSASGTSFALTDTSEGNVLAHSIYGMSVQDGTPTPSSPVDIESAKADFKCVGKNLIPYPWYETSSATRNGVSYTIDGQSVKVNRESSSSSNANFWLYRFSTDFMGLKSGRYILSGSGSADILVAVAFYQDSTWVSQINAATSDAVVDIDTASDTYNNIGITVYVSKTSNPSNVVVKPMLRLATVEDSTYEPYHSTTADTDLTLRAIEVTSSDDYNLVRDGKYYIADSVEWSEDDGYVLTRRIANASVTDFTDWTYNASGSPQHNIYIGASTVFGTNIVIPSVDYKNAYLTSNYLQTITRNELSVDGEEGIAIGTSTNLILQIDGITSKADYESWISGKTLDLLAVLATPVVTPLTAQQAEALLSLKTYDTATSITCTSDVSPTMEIEYAKERVPALALSGHNESELKVDWASENVLGAKNLIPYPYYETTETVNGITFTDNGDGSVTIDGTATADVAFRFLHNSTPFDNLVGKNVTITGCPSGGSTSTYYINFWGCTQGISLRDYGNGGTAVFNPSGSYGITFVIMSGQTFNSVTIYPMLRLASVKDPTYAPYAMTNYELTQKIRELETAIIELGGN